MLVGEFNKLKILRTTSVGLYLGDESGEDILLPNKYCPEEFEIDDTIEVFVYRDYEDRKIATNIIPKILLHEFGFLKVIDVSEVGAFLDWGLEKDLLVPFREQRQKMEVDRWYVVFLEIDLKTDRLYATNRIERVLNNDILSVEVGEKVDLIIMQKTDLGYTVIVNQQHKGLIYENEVFKKLNIGEKVEGYIKKIREENKLDISLQPIGYRQFNDVNAELIFDKLQRSGGFIPLTDKSDPESIYKEFEISKKAFKKAVGSLYRDRKITIETDGIRLA